MHDLFEKKQRDNILQRLDNMTEDNKAQWGEMEMGTMLAHLIDCFVITFKEKEVSCKPSFMSTAFGRWLIFRMPFPKGKVKAPPEFHESKAGVFADDVQRIKAYVKRFEQQDQQWGISPAFGNLTGKHWAQINLRHTDHHLKQFSV